MRGHQHRQVVRLHVDPRRRHVGGLPDRQLRGSGEAGAGLQHGHAVGRVPRCQSQALRPRPDQGHRAPQHVPQLGQLVERGAPQEGADTGDPWVMGDGQAGARGTDAHGAQLDQPERPAVLADPLLVEEQRPPVLEQDERAGQREERGGGDHEQGAEHEVARAAGRTHGERVSAVPARRGRGSSPGRRRGHRVLLRSVRPRRTRRRRRWRPGRTRAPAWALGRQGAGRQVREQDRPVAVRASRTSQSGFGRRSGASRL